MSRVAALLAAALLAAGAAGCGGSGAEPGAPDGATLVLDFTPNAVHSGIYAARAQGFYRDAGVDLSIRVPGESTDAPKLLEAGRADFAILDIHDLGIAREHGFDIVGAMPIVQRPLAAVLARGDGPVRRPRDLEGHSVGVTGLPSDEAVVDSEVSADGGDPARVDRVTIGFNAVASLAAGKVDAATGFWNAEGVALRGEGIPIRVFKVDEYGAPPYPELVLTASRKTIEARPDLVDAVVARRPRLPLRGRASRRGDRRPGRGQPGPRPRRTGRPDAGARPRPPPRPVRPACPAGMGGVGPRARPAQPPARRGKGFSGWRRPHAEAIVGPMKRVRVRITYANVVSTLALFLVLGGGAAFAATKLTTSDIKKGAIKTKLLAKNAVSSAKIASNAVKTRNIAPSAVGGGQLAADSVDGSKVLNGSLTPADLLGGASVVATATGGPANVGSTETPLPLNGGTWTRAPPRTTSSRPGSKRRSRPGRRRRPARSSSTSNSTESQSGRSACSARAAPRRPRRAKCSAAPTSPPGPRRRGS